VVQQQAVRIAELEKRLNKNSSKNTMWLGWYILKFVRESSWLLSEKSKSKAGVEKRGRI
jgi:hypothetical protein